jgi:hypothetical protein
MVRHLFGKQVGRRVMCEHSWIEVTAIACAGLVAMVSFARSRSDPTLVSLAMLPEELQAAAITAFPP